MKAIRIDCFDDEEHTKDNNKDAHNTDISNVSNIKSNNTVNSNSRRASRIDLDGENKGYSSVELENHRKMMRFIAPSTLVSNVFGYMYIYICMRTRLCI